MTRFVLETRALGGAFVAGVVVGLALPAVASFLREASRRRVVSPDQHRLIIDGARPADPAALASRAGTETNSSTSPLASECPTDVFAVRERW